MMSTEAGGFVETSDGTLIHFTDLDLHAEALLTEGAFDVREHVLAGGGHLPNVQVTEKVNPLLASALGIPREDLVPQR